MTRLALFSVAVALAAASLDVAIGLPLAYLLGRRRFPGRRALEAILCLPLVLPPTVTGFALLVLFGHRGVLGLALDRAFGLTVPFTPAANVLAAATVAFPLFLRTARAAIEAVPAEHVLDARALGLSPWRAATRVVLPLASRGLWAGAALAVGRALGEFGATLMLAGDVPGRTQTLSLGVFDAALRGNDGRAAALSLLLVAISFALLLPASALERAR